MANVRYVIFKRCVSGDRKKVQRSSNWDPAQGGGARDLRFNPWQTFEGVVSQMFTNVRTVRGGRTVYSAPVYWVENGKQLGPVTVEFWSPTPSRSGEGRLATVSDVTPFDEHHLPPAAADPFFMLWQDTNNVVWAQYVTVSDLQRPNWAKVVSDPILEAVATVTAEKNIRGWVNVQTGQCELVAR